MNIGPYRIVRKLGQGGMSNVYLTEDVRTGRFVALKLLAPRVSADETYRLRLLREAHVIASVRHRNITAIYEADQFQDQPYIAMEFVAGETVADMLCRGRVAPAQAVRIAAEAASALAAAHAAGVVHRDIKSSNIMIQPSGDVKVMDFGLAKFEEIEGQPEDESTGAMRNLTARGTILGTVNYMSPEQARGETVDPRGDIFSLGVVLYEMLAAVPPFRANYAFAVLRQIINDDPKPVTYYSPEVTADVQAILTRALAKRPDARFGSAREMETALREVASSQ
jgi:eukaryotic-like serine/threonine-protein kinase